MTDIEQGRAARTERAHGRSQEVTGWVGWVVFAGVMMSMVGFFSVINGLIALFNDDYYLVGASGLVVNVDYTVWGWIHLLLGILVGAAGVGVMIGQTWARVVGVVLATIIAIVNFGFLPAYPIWSTIIIALTVFVIYALVVHGREASVYR